MTKVVFDAETTILHKGHPFTEANWLVSYAVKVDGGATSFHYHSEPDFVSHIRGVVSQCSLFIGFNAKFDLHWLWRNDITLPRGCRVFDCSLAEYVLTGQQASFASLNQCLEEYGFPLKHDKIAEYWKAGISTEFIPVAELEEYNVYDVDGTHALYEAQMALLPPKQLHLVLQMGDDLLALAAAEQNGIKFDDEESINKLNEYISLLNRVEESLSLYLPVLPDSCTFNWDSGDQLSAFLYGGRITYAYAISEPAVYKTGEKKGESYIRNRWHEEEVSFQKIFTPLEGTSVAKSSSERPIFQTDEPTLKQLICRTKQQRLIISLLQQRAKLIQVVSMINSIKERIDKYQWKDNLIHGQFNQNVARTGRLSSSNPNMQNFPEEVDQLIVSRYNE